MIGATYGGDQVCVSVTFLVVVVLALLAVWLILRILGRR